MAIIAFGSRPHKEPPTSSPDEGKGQTEPARPEPDVRFTLANERTFLAWARTALALVAAGLAITQLLPPFPHAPWGRPVIATPLILLGAVLPGLSYADWRRTQRAIAMGEPVPPSRLPLVLAVTVGVIALAAVGIDLYSKVSGR